MFMAPQVQIQIVTWNSREHLERLFLGIEKQEGVDFSIVIIDNASNDGAVEWLENAKSRNEFGMTIIRNSTNRGFAAGHNQGFVICEAPYVLVLNPDTELQVGYLAEVLRVMESTEPLTLTLSQRERGLSDGRIASVQGKLFRELPRGEKYGIIDSCGLEMKFLGQVADIGQNSSDKANFKPLDPLAPHPNPLPKGEGVTEVFGATGACALYRLEALKQVADKHGIFDERFGSYKEDVDLAWRLHRAGWKAVFTPQAVAWHGRGVGKGDVKTWRIRYLSLRNHLLMLIKNLL